MGELYRFRWQIDLIFKWINQHLPDSADSKFRSSSPLHHGADDDPPQRSDRNVPREPARQSAARLCLREPRSFTGDDYLLLVAELKDGLGAWLWHRCPGVRHTDVPFRANSKFRSGNGRPVGPPPARLARAVVNALPTAALSNGEFRQPNSTTSHRYDL